MLVLQYCRQFHHKYVQSKVFKPLFHYVAQIAYISIIHFLFNQSYFRYYLLLFFYFNIIGHFRFQFFIMFYLGILRLLGETI